MKSKSFEVEIKEVNIEILYKHYLKLSKLDENKMMPVQRIETKRAFMAGLSTFLKFQSEDISRLPVKGQIEKLTDLNNQLVTFWNIQMAKNDSKGKE